jgi:DNA-binding response OmpR family regulator
VASATAAIAAISSSAYDLVLLDLHLRGESGVAVIAHLKADPALSATPVILLSGDFDGRTDGYASRYGADLALGKPFEPAELTAAVRALLTRKGVR